MTLFSNYNWLFSSVLLLVGRYAFAQETTMPLNGFKSTITRDIRLDALLDSTIARNQHAPDIKGYRIQLYTGTERKGALEVKSELQKKFPELRTYIIYQQPYFKVRVGDYRNQVEAQPDYYKLQLSGKFSKAFIIPDMINLPNED